MPRIPKAHTNVQTTEIITVQKRQIDKRQTDDRWLVMRNAWSNVSVNVAWISSIAQVFA